MTQHFAAVSVNNRACTTSAKRSGPSHLWAPCSVLRSTSTFLFFSLLEKKTRWLHSLPKRQTAVADPWTKQPVKIKVLGIFPWQERGREREELRLAGWRGFSLLNCKGSWYKLGLPVFPPCWQAVSSQDIPCRRSKVWKNKHKQQFGKMKRRERSVMSFFLPWKTSSLPSQSVPSYSVTSCKLFPLREGGKKKATYFKYLASSYLNKETDKDANAQFLSLVTQKKMAEWLDMSLHGLQLLTSAHKALFHF